jgi:hypothetical protein
MSAFLAALPLIGSLLDKVLPDADAKAKAQLELAKLAQDGEFKALDMQLQVNLAQAKINEIEAASSNPMAATWRPAAGWVCVFGLGYEFLLRPLLPWILAVCQVPDVPALPSLDDVLMELVFAMLGIGGMRTFERSQRVKKIVEAANTGR